MKMNLLNIDHKDREIMLYYRDEKGNLNVKTDKGFFPYYYEVDPDGSFKSYDGKNLRKVFVSHPKELRKRISSTAYECDIHYGKRYILDKIDEITKCPIKYCMIDIEVLAKGDIFKKLEQGVADYPVSCITVYNSFSKDYITFYLGEFEEEYMMLADFMDYMKKEAFDIQLYWHSDFDYKYLNTRIPDYASKISVNGKNRYGKRDMYYPSGSSIIDYCEWYKKVTLNRKEEYTLNFVAKEELGRKKVHEEVNFSELSTIIKERNIDDVKIMVELEEKLGIIDYYNAVRIMAKCEWEDLVWHSRIVDMLLLKEAKNQKIVLPSKRQDREKDDFDGAFREVFERGYHEGIKSWDLSSAYPRCIIDFCLDPNNVGNKGLKIDILKDIKEDGEIVRREYDKTYRFKQNKNSLLPVIVEKIMKLKTGIGIEKKSTSENSPGYKDIDMKYSAIKTILNACYGSFGEQRFRLYSLPVAETTTFLVRDLLHFVKDKLDEKGYKIIYVDTDGVQIKCDEDITEYMNELIQQWAKEKFGKDHIDIKFEYEGIFTQIFILALCRYIGWRTNPKGEVSLKKVGIEAKRKDSTVFIKKFTLEFFDRIFKKQSKEEIQSWIKKCIKNFSFEKLECIAIPCRIGKSLDEYKNEPIFARALRYTRETNPEFNKEIGEKYYYLYIKSDEYEIKKVDKILIKTWNKAGEDKGFKNLTDKRMDFALSKFDCSEQKLIEKGMLKKETVKEKGKNKDVIAFDIKNTEHVKNIDWSRMLDRNIYLKLEVPFEALKWDMKDIR